MVTMELHCWGNEKGFHKFHPESVAAVWYMLLGDFEFKIVPSSNNIIGKLPFLIDNDKIISGFESIILHLKDKVHIDEELDNDNRLVNCGLRSLISNKINSITQYTLFLNKENYENYSRGLFKYLLPFPMQYTPPLDFKNDAIRMCLQIGLDPDNGLVITEGDNRYQEILQTEKQLKLTPTLGTLHSAQKEQLLSKLLLEKSTVNNMRAIGLFETYISQILELRTDLKTEEKPYIFGDTASSADLLLFAQLTALTLPELPNQFMKIAIEYKQPKLLKDLKIFTNFINSKLENVEIVVPSDEYYPSLYNYIKHQFKTFV